MRAAKLEGGRRMKMSAVGIRPTWTGTALVSSQRGGYGGSAAATKAQFIQFTLGYLPSTSVFVTQ